MKKKMQIYEIIDLLNKICPEVDCGGNFLPPDEIDEIYEAIDQAEMILEEYEKLTKEHPELFDNQ